MSQLNDKKRLAFALHEIEGLGLTEIGEMLGASPQTIWARVKSARAELQKRLGPLLDELGARSPGDGVES